MAILIGATVVHKITRIHGKTRFKVACHKSGVLVADAGIANDPRIQLDIQWDENALKANGINLPLCCHCRDRRGPRFDRRNRKRQPMRAHQ